MKINWNRMLAIALPMVMSIFGLGCQMGGGGAPAGPPMLGSNIDLINQTQEINAEASKYIVYMHEFETIESDDKYKNGVRLNSDGEDHLKQIAVNLKQGASFPVVVERSWTSPKPGTTYHYPIHLNDELDMKRRTVVVSALAALGVHNAEQVVVVGPSAAEGYTAPEARRAYNRGLWGNSGGGGGGFGGFGGGGGGGFGGGFF